ncbi:hypothetical protein [Motiliproteus sp. SC1-56]|uniref:hypothetical protein n=1 Tax=Motiliproteus sp. SC1-56 TaxID=2799565 RepID=UPI001A8E48DE|nr:hypothetical protein [Motiliproteus sp. SC1-56]
MTRARWPRNLLSGSRSGLESGGFAVALLNLQEKARAYGLAETPSFRLTQARSLPRQ